MNRGVHVNKTTFAQLGSCLSNQRTAVGYHGAEDACGLVDTHE
jgi:hypothetical protein